MVRRIAFPFNTLSDHSVNSDGWMLTLDGGLLQEAGDYLPDWDAASTVNVSREIDLDWEMVCQNLAIPSDELVLALVCRVGSGTGRLPRQVLISRSHILGSTKTSTKIELTIPGKGLSGLIELGTSLILAKDTENKDPLAPGHAGSRVWSDKKRILLEGEAPRLPIEAVNFDQIFGTALPKQSPWYLLWAPRDWSRDFHGAIRLLLNENDQNLINKIEEEDELVLQAMMSDIMGQICTRLILDPQADELFTTPEPGSLAAQAVAWLKHAWPGKDLRFIRKLLGTRPGEFQATILALAAPFES